MSRRDAAPIYGHSFLCGACDWRFVIFTPFFGIDPAVTACPHCHVVGRFRHWRRRLPNGTRGDDVHPWPRSRCVDAEDATHLQRYLELAAPEARQYYTRTGIAPWGFDQRKPAEWPPKHTLPRGYVINCHACGWTLEPRPGEALNDLVPCRACGSAEIFPEPMIGLDHAP